MEVIWVATKVATKHNPWVWLEANWNSCCFWQFAIYQVVWPTHTIMELFWVWWCLLMASKRQKFIQTKLRLHVQALWAYASWTMLTGLQATCTHAHKPSGHMQAHAQKPSGYMHASSPRASASFNQGNKPMRSYSMLSHKHGLLLFKDMCQIFLAQWIFLCGHCH